MRKFKIDFETIKYPLIIMLMMSVLKGISNTILSDAVAPYIGSSYQWLIGLMGIMQYFSSVVIQYLPFIFIIMYLVKTYRDQRIIVMFFVSFILIATTTAVVGSTSLPQQAYGSLFSLNLEKTLSINSIQVILQPFRIGFFATLISATIVAYSYRATRTRTRYALFNFIDKDSLATMYTVVISFIVGLILVFVWPIVINILFSIINWIGSDISNPTHLYAYGILDKLLGIFELSPLNKSTFLFQEMGGTWISNTGVSFVGDANIWKAVLNFSVFDTGFGRYMTPYYIINLFAIPGIFVGLISLYTKKSERYNHAVLLIFLTIFTFIADLSLPVEIFIFITAPLLFVFHIIITGFLFAVLSTSKIVLGSVFADGVNNIAYGNGLELIGYLKNHNLVTTVISIFIIGVIVLLLYVIVTRIYYKHFAIGLINKYEIDHTVDQFLEIVGGIDNIEEINSSPFRVSVKLKRPQMFDYDLLEQSNVSRVNETRSEYALYYGTISTIIRSNVLLRKQLISED